MADRQSDDGRSRQPSVQTLRRLGRTVLDLTVTLVVSGTA